MKLLNLKIDKIVRNKNQPRKNFDIENKSLKGKELNFERYRDNRDEMNVERISKEDFLKELEIIVNAYEDIYNDNEVQKMFENFKENF